MCQHWWGACQLPQSHHKSYCKTITFYLCILLSYSNLCLPFTEHVHLLRYTFILHETYYCYFTDHLRTRGTLRYMGMKLLSW